LEAPGIALLHREDCCDFLLWDADGAIVHIASIELIGKDEFDIRRRLAARIRRYSEIVGKDGAGCAVYSNGQFDREAFDLAFLGTGPMLRPWPGSTSRQSRNLKVRL
jgi:hypothetical protein